MPVVTDFPGGNLRILKREGDTCFVENELRDTQGEWFYWAFAVEGEAGHTLTFDFGDKSVIGPYGPAVSRDGVHFSWLCAGTSVGFSYPFRDDGRVYFAHDLLYQTARFDALAQELGLLPETLCMSERGRSIPVVHFGEGGCSILLTARHHACESTGSYVLEGVLRRLAQEPIPGYRVTAVPFVDFDGVMDGDQGKNRRPHDHNRDYLTHPLYASVQALQELIYRERPRYILDFHAPGHSGYENDYAFIVRKGTDSLPLQRRFGELLEASLVPGSFPYVTKRDLAPNTGWNQDKTLKSALSGFAARTHFVRLMVTLETSYFGLPDAPATQDSLMRLGISAAEALRRLIAEEKK